MPLDCIDEFKIGCCSCGGVCNCGRRKVVHESVGGCVPKQPDPFRLYQPHRCNPQGGTKTVGAPEYQLVIENPSDDILRDEQGVPILVNGEVQHKPVETVEPVECNSV